MANKSSTTGSIKEFRKKITNIHELISTAYHEAGHTIYGLLHLMKIDYICIFENRKLKRIEGLTYFYSPSLNNFNDPVLLQNILYSEICFRYAGLTAEKYYFKKISGSDKFPLFLRDWSSDDTMCASNLIRQYNVAPPGKKRYSYKKRIISETLNTLSKYWNDVTIIAHALFDKKKLNDSEVKQLLLKKSKNKEFWKKQFKIIDNIYNNNAYIDEHSYKITLSI